jgi:hypothetical protein
VWIITTWQFISPEVTVKGYKKYRIFSATDGMLWNGSAEVGNTRNECEKDESTDREE